MRKERKEKKLIRQRRRQLRELGFGEGEIDFIFGKYQEEEGKMQKFKDYLKFCKKFNLAPCRAESLAAFYGREK